MTDSEVLASLRVQILEARPGDMVVLVGTESMTREQAVQVREQVDSLLPEGVRVMVTTGVTVNGVIRPADPDLLLAGPGESA